jgi:enoyl-CoA hydratase/carnithine racemase
MAETGDNIYKGGSGYVTLQRVEHNGRTGALLQYVNPDPRKLHAIDTQGMVEFTEAIGAAEADTTLQFLVLYGAYDPLHAGADVTQFAGEPDYATIREHLHRGTELDARIKQLWPRLRTVAVLCGNRFGGSVEWPLFAEFGVADSNTTIQLSEVQLGILPGWNGILNVMLKSNPSNAQYMASTGNPVNAEQMLQMGLVQAIVDTPAPPDRNLTPPDLWAAQWQGHATAAQDQLLAAALELATGDSAAPATPSNFNLTDADTYFAEIGRRTQDTEYRDLRQSVQDRLAALGDSPEPEQLKELNRWVQQELALLGKPLAPDAVNYVQRYVKQFGALSREEILARYAELGKVEADMCVELMHHAHRREGVNAVLSKHPAERVPVFAEVDYSQERVSPYEGSEGDGV